MRSFQIFLIWPVILFGCGNAADSPVAPPVAIPTLSTHNHNSEVSIAVTPEVVALVSVNQKHASAASFDDRLTDDPNYRQVALAVSRDGGRSFEPPVAIAVDAPETTDPVIVSDASGFWISTLDPDAGQVHLIRSRDHGTSWETVGDPLPIIDKEWLTVDSATGTAFVAGYGGYFELDPAGTVLASFETVALTQSIMGAFARDGEVRMLAENSSVVAWAPPQPPAREGPFFDPGDEPNPWTRTSGAIGELTNHDGYWIVYGQRFSDHAPIVVEQRWPGTDETVALTITEPGTTGFLPAATMDEEGILHVVWYDSSGDVGVLRYTRSLTSDPVGAYAPSIVVDAEACPGMAWYPHAPNEPPSGGRRLREYIGIAVLGPRVHVAWTRAASPPSRIYTTSIAHRALID